MNRRMSERMILGRLERAIEARALVRIETTDEVIHGTPEAIRRGWDQPRDEDGERRGDVVVVAVRGGLAHGLVEHIGLPRIRRVEVQP